MHNDKIPAHFLSPQYIYCLKFLVRLVYVARMPSRRPVLAPALRQAAAPKRRQPPHLHAFNPSTRTLPTTRAHTPPTPAPARRQTPRPHAVNPRTPAPARLHPPAPHAVIPRAPTPPTTRAVISCARPFNLSPQRVPVTPSSLLHRRRVQRIRGETPACAIQGISGASYRRAGVRDINAEDRRQQGTRRQGRRPVTGDVPGSVKGLGEDGRGEGGLGGWYVRGGVREEAWPGRPVAGCRGRGGGKGARGLAVWWLAAV